MYLGKLCEVAPPEDLYHVPEHPYTEALLTSIPEPDPGAARDGTATLTGDLPSPINPPSGCRFRTRCQYAQQRCADEEPQMRAIGPGHFVACHFPLGGGTATLPDTPVSEHVPVPSSTPVTPPGGDVARQPPSWAVQSPDPGPDASSGAGDRPPLWIDPQG
jgi:oligopeptide/dipeptide ABC transporter ATP-binding protein